MPDPLADTRAYLAAPRTIANFRAWLNLQAENEDYNAGQRNIFRAWAAPGVVEGIDRFMGVGNSDGSIQIAEFNAAVNGMFTIARAGTLLPPPPRAGAPAAPLPAPGYGQALNAAFLDQVFGALPGGATLTLEQARARAADAALPPLVRHTLRALIRNWSTLKNNGNDISRATLETNIRETFGIPRATALTLRHLENFIQFKIAERIYGNAYISVAAPNGVGAQIENPLVIQGSGGGFPTTAAGRAAFIRDNSTGGVLRLTVIRRSNTTCTFFIPPQITTVDNPAYPAAIEQSVQTHPTSGQLDSRPATDHASLMRLLIISSTLPIPTGVGHNGYRYAMPSAPYPATGVRQHVAISDTTFLSRFARTFFTPGGTLSFITAQGLPRIPARFPVGGSTAGTQYRPITTTALDNPLHATNGFSSGQTGLDAVLRILRNP